jgi:hypothetical protein
VKSISEAREFIRGVLGDGPVQQFDLGVDEIMCYAKFCALSGEDLGGSGDTPEEHMTLTATGVMSEIIDTFLANNGSRYGDVIMDSNATFYDQDMNVIEPIQEVTRAQVEIVSVIVRSVMYVFATGRDLAQNISSNCARVDPEMGEEALSYSRDSVKPLEVVEAEIVYLEGKLPDIADHERSRLMELYRERRTYGRKGH